VGFPLLSLTQGTAGLRRTIDRSYYIWPMPSATIKLFLVSGEPKALRTAEISNWNGKAVAGPRNEFDVLLKRDEAALSGVYFLTGTDPDTGRPALYVGEAECLKDRLKKHLGKDFWNHAVFFVGNENLTKAHVRYLEGRLIQEAKGIGRVELKNGQGSGAKLPESDTADMEVFLKKVFQLLPVLGVDAFVPLSAVSTNKSDLLRSEIKGLKATGRLTSNGIVVLKGSQAVLEVRPSASKYPWSAELRRQLKADGALIVRPNCLEFTKDVEFSSPSAAATLLQGGQTNGLTAWKDSQDRSLKDRETRL